MALNTSLIFAVLNNRHFPAHIVAHRLPDKRRVIARFCFLTVVEEMKLINALDAGLQDEALSDLHELTVRIKQHAGQKLAELGDQPASGKRFGLIKLCLLCDLALKELATSR